MDFRILAWKQLFHIILLTNNIWTRLNPMQNLTLYLIWFHKHSRNSKDSYLKFDFKISAWEQLFHIILPTNNIWTRINPLQILIWNLTCLHRHLPNSKGSYLKMDFWISVWKQIFHIILPTNNICTRLNQIQNLILDTTWFHQQPPNSEGSYLKWDF